MTTSQFTAATAFRLAFARRQAARVVELEGGFAVLDGEFSRSHEHNQLFITGPVDPATVLEAAESVLGGLRHRRISVLDEGTARALAPTLERAGYGHDSEVVMVHTGPVPPAEGAEPIGLETLRPALARQLRLWIPNAEEESIRQLVDRYAARLRGAEQVLMLGARDGDGEVGAWGDLYLQPTEGIAEIESLVTAEGRTRRGLADAVLGTALRLADRAGCGLRFLVADAEDWPQHWYARRGFTTVGRSHAFSRF